MTTPIPAPSAMRLLGPAAKAPRPPFGLGAWTETAEALAVVLDVHDLPASATAQVGAVARQLPRASELAPGTLVVVLGDSMPAGGLFARLRRPAHVARALRCTALLARGFVDVGGGVDPKSGQDLAWATATSC